IEQFAWAVHLAPDRRASSESPRRRRRTTVEIVLSSVPGQMTTLECCCRGSRGAPGHPRTHRVRARRLGTRRARCDWARRREPASPPPLFDPAEHRGRGRPDRNGGWPRDRLPRLRCGEWLTCATLLVRVPIAASTIVKRLTAATKGLH